MPLFPLFHGSNRFENAGADTSDTSGAAATVNSTNTKSSYAQIISSTAFDASGFWFNVYFSDAGTYLFDIAVGAASSEQVIVENLLLPVGKAFETSRPIWFPIEIPEGTRISFRFQGLGFLGTADPEAVILLSPGTFQWFESLGKCTTYGADTSDSGGVSIDPGGSANTKGSWTQIASSTSEDIKMLYVGLGGQNNGVRTDAHFLVDIGVGAAASEQVVVPNAFIALDQSDDTFRPHFLGPFFVDIPAGERIAIRSQCDITDAADRLLDMVIYGLG